MRNHGDEQQGHGKRYEQRRDDGDPDMMSHQSDHEIGGEQKGQKHRNRCQCGGKDGAPDLLRPLYHGRLCIFTSRSQTIDTLQHHHTVVQQHTYREGHPNEREAVYRDAECIEEVERCKDRNGNRQCNGDHQGEVPQKHPENDYSQASANERQLDDKVDIPLHGFCHIALNHDLDIQ